MFSVVVVVVCVGWLWVLGCRVWFIVGICAWVLFVVRWRWLELVTVFCCCGVVCELLLFVCVRCIRVCGVV